MQSESIVLRDPACELLARAPRDVGGKTVPSILQIGIGRWGVHHLRVWKKLEQLGLCCVLGVIEADESKHAQLMKDFDVFCFMPDFLQDILPLADAVDITVPIPEHFAVAMACLEAEKHMLVEKPLVETLRQYATLTALSLRHPACQIMVGHILQYHPLTGYLKTMVENNDLGQILFLRGRIQDGGPPARDGGIVATRAMHLIYAANYILGQKPTSVTAEVKHLRGQRFDDYAHITLHYPAGVFCEIEADYCTPGKCRTLQVVGTDETATLDFHRHVLTHAACRDSELPILPHMQSIVGGDEEPLECELRHFLACVVSGDRPATGIQESYMTSWIVDAVYRVGTAGGRISI